MIIGFYYFKTPLTFLCLKSDLLSLRVHTIKGLEPLIVTLELL